MKITGIPRSDDGVQVVAGGGGPDHVAGRARLVGDTDDRGMGLRTDAPDMEAGEGINPAITRIVPKPYKPRDVASLVRALLSRPVK